MLSLLRLLALSAFCIVFVHHAHGALRNLGQDLDDEEIQGFPAHEYLSDLVEYRGDLPSWQSALRPAVENGSFTVIFHGMRGAGKTRMVQRLTGRNIADKPTTTTTLQRILIGKHSIVVIDTPGFGNPTSKKREECMVGMDKAVQLAKHHNWAPVRRIYFFLDLAQSRGQVPETIKTNLEMMTLAYGVTQPFDIVFVVSKCDVLKDRLSRDDFVQWRKTIAGRFNQFWRSSVYAPESVVLTSANGCLRPLVTDLIRASGNRAIKVPGPILSSPWCKTHDRLLDVSKYLQEHAKDYGQHFDPIANYPDLQTLQNRYEYVVDQQLRLFGKFLSDYSESMHQKSEAESTATLYLQLVPFLGQLTSIGTGIAAHKHKGHSQDASSLYSEVCRLQEELRKAYPKDFCL